MKYGSIFSLSPVKTKIKFGSEKIKTSLRIVRTAQNCKKKKKGFFFLDGVVAQIVVPEGQTVTSVL